MPLTLLSGIALFQISFEELQAVNPGPASLKHSPSDTAGETALHVLPFRCLHLGLSGGRSLSAKARGIWLNAWSSLTG
jgi:hypothetical protein